MYGHNAYDIRGLPERSGNTRNLRLGKHEKYQNSHARDRRGNRHRAWQELIGMKTVLYNGSRQIPVDTRHDECLFAAPRPAKTSADIQHLGKDLYLHMDRGKNATWYLHLWSTNRATKEKILVMSPQNAERFLRSKGLICDLFPKSDPVATLYQWGYGIAEAF